jgi:hypothetical protein
VPLYQWREQYAPPDAVTDYTPIPRSAYGQTGNGGNAFPEAYAYHGTDAAAPNPIPVPYGPTQQPLRS